jgi:hypothetical protein
MDKAQFENSNQSVAELTKNRVSLFPTLATGFTMLIVGIMVGYFGRPLLAPETPTPTVAQSADNPSAEELMDSLVARTRHFKGDSNAPVTIIEFGDFQ